MSIKNKTWASIVGAGMSNANNTDQSKKSKNDNYQDKESSATRASMVSTQDNQKPVAKKYVRPVLPGARGSSNWEDDIEDYGECLYIKFRKYYQHESAEKMVWLFADLKETELHKLCGTCQSSLTLLRHIAYKANEVLEAANANEYIVNNDKYIVRNGNKYIVTNYWFNSDLLKEMKCIIAQND